MTGSKKEVEFSYEQRPPIGNALAAYVTNDKGTTVHLYPVVDGKYIRVSVVNQIADFVNKGYKVKCRRPGDSGKWK